MLDGDGLLGGLDDVKLGAESDGLLTVGCDFAIETGAEGFFAAEGGGGFSRLALGSGKGGFGLGDFGGKGAQRERKTSALEVDTLQLYEGFNLRLHP